METEKVDVLVIGAGPSGTVSASILAKQGLNVKVVEKSKFPRFVIGESLIPSCMEPLEKAGFMEVLKAQGFEKKHGAKFIRNGSECVFDFADQYTDAWKWTWQLPRADFDKVLADELEKQGTPIQYETLVTDIKFNGTDSLTTIQDKGGKQSQIEARFLMDASGYGRVIPRLFDLDEPSDLSPKRASFVHVEDKNRPDGEAGTQITFVVIRKDVWFWIIPFSNGITSLGFVGDPAYFDDFEGAGEHHFREMIKSDPNFADRFKNAQMVFEPKTIDAYSIGVKTLYGDGFALTGNSTEFLDPIFSSGVAFAVNSAALAAKLAAKQLKGETVDWANDYEAYINHGVDTFRSYVNAWYDGSLQEIFFEPNYNADIRAKICSVLAGYVWDKTNPYVRRHATAIKSLVEIIRM